MSGDGFASPTTRELTGRGAPLYHGLGRRPKENEQPVPGRVEDFARTVSAEPLRSFFPRGDRPELLLEPGRSVASASQFLLLRSTM